jgi:hypothetical protein
MRHPTKDLIPFRARPWMLNNSEDFLSWRKRSVPLRMQVFADTVAAFVSLPPEPLGASAEDIVLCLPEVLRSCDSLGFRRNAEVLAYASLHLVDRYGRVTLGLEHLFQCGLLPIRRQAIRILEVGAGPAPALFATRDFYADLAGWPSRGDVQIAPVTQAYSVERGTAWPSFLHNLSERLISHGGAKPGEGALPFQVTFSQLSGLDLRQEHQHALAGRAYQIISEAEDVDEWISDGAASQLAHKEGVLVPSAYDLVFICNFLTQQSMTTEFERELRNLACALTPGGLLLVLGSVNKKYDPIFADTRRYAIEEGLTELDSRVFTPNEADMLPIVAGQIRASVAAFLGACSASARSLILGQLPPELVYPDIDFRLPNFQLLIFVRREVTFARWSRRKKNRRPSAD